MTSAAMKNLFASISSAGKSAVGVLKNMKLNLSLSVKQVWQRSKSSLPDPPTPPPTQSPPVPDVPVGPDVIVVVDDDVAVEPSLYKWPVLVAAGVAVVSLLAGGCYYLLRRFRTRCPCCNGCQGMINKNYYSCSKVVNYNCCCWENRNNRCVNAPGGNGGEAIQNEGQR